MTCSQIIQNRRLIIYGPYLECFSFDPLLCFGLLQAACFYCCLIFLYHFIYDFFLMIELILEFSSFRSLFLICLFLFILIFNQLCFTFFQISKITSAFRLSHHLLILTNASLIGLFLFLLISLMPGTFSFFTQISLF